MEKCELVLLENVAPPQPAVIDNDMAAFLDMQLVTVKKPDAHKLFRDFAVPLHRRSFGG